MKIAEPSTFDGVSSRWRSLPISVNFAGSFRTGSWGAGIVAARSANSPKPLSLPEAAWAIRPFATVISPGGTSQDLAAAATSIARAVAPALRIWV